MSHATCRLWVQVEFQLSGTSARRVSSSSGGERFAVLVVSRTRGGRPPGLHPQREVPGRPVCSRLGLGQLGARRPSTRSRIRGPRLASRISSPGVHPMGGGMWTAMSWS